ncbi:MAG: cytochrome d ubiquinol oxidase subunit II [Corynebacterium kroppenstedtii]|nr:cytochrome d ubiquinol oxidase subunit II [Corynebacterium kroppenstedtii]
MLNFDLPTLWFILIGFLFAGYFLLEGFDFGVGMLLPFLGTDEPKRSAMMSTIGPVWDGNEVWLITAGGSIFAAFPMWYADIFSGYYIPLFLILLALIVRVVSIEWREKVNTETWRQWCDRGIVLGSWLPPAIWGVAIANMIRGVPDDASRVYPLFNFYGIVGALAFVFVFLFHGALFIRLKTAGVLRSQARKLTTIFASLAIVFGGAFVLWTQFSYGKTVTWIWTGFAVAGLALGLVFALRDRDGWAFFLTCISIISVTGLAFSAMFPSVWNGLDVWDAASGRYTLSVLTWCAAFGMPFVVMYQAWTYWVFRKRITAKPASSE